MRAAIQRHELGTIEQEADRHNGTSGARTALKEVLRVDDARVGKQTHIKSSSLFSLLIEPQTGADPLHVHSLFSRDADHPTDPESVGEHAEAGRPKCFSHGIFTWPPSASAVKARLASASVGMASESIKPLKLKPSSHPSEAMSVVPPM